MNTATMTFPITPPEEYPEDFSATQELSTGDEDLSVQWMYRIASGDSKAIDLIVEKWKMPIINFAYRSLGNFEDAEDIALKSFKKLYDSAGRYEPKAKFSTYLFTIVNRLVISEIRKRKSRKIMAVDPEELVQVSHEKESDSQASRELEEIFLRALQAIPENLRAALVLVIQEELPYTEASKVLGISEGNLRTQISRGRKLLKKEMEGML